MSKYFIGVISKDHAQGAVEGNFTQVCHGKKGPLAKMKQGDWFIIYSPKTSMKSNIKYQKFTAIGQVADDTIYQVDMGGGFVPFRRNITFDPNAQELDIYAIKDKLSFTQPKNWGMKLRYGFFEISQEDFEIIKKGMKI